MIVYNLDVLDFDTYFVGDVSVLVHNYGKGSNIPVPEETIAENGLRYKSNPKHSPGQFGNGPKAGIEPQNSLDLFSKSISSDKPNVRFAYDPETGAIHRFCESNGCWHWNGSTNQGANSLSSSQIPGNVKKEFGVKSKGW